MAARWVDLVDPSRQEVLQALPGHVDPEVVEVLATPSPDERGPRPLLEGHGAYVFGVLVAMRPVPDEDRISYQEIDIVATAELLVTVRKTPSDGVAFDPEAIHLAAEADEPCGVLVQKLFDEVADSYLEALDAGHAEVEELEDSLDLWPSARVRARVTALRHEFLHIRKTVAATRAAVRRILDGRVDVGDHALFPAEVERLFGNTYEILQRAAEELEIARELLAGARDHHQSQIAEGNSDIGKKLTVIASLVLVPTFIVGFYGQNFASAFDEVYWSNAVSMALIVGSTIVQVALFRWRRWI
jgi:Mg2+ and Co2+ transporter CorA